MRGSDWEQMWANGVSPGDYFDKETTLPELHRVLKDGGLPTGGRVLVPGCGRGYDVEAFCKSDVYSKVVGMDISESAVRAANKYLAESGVKGWEVVAGDFFASGAEKDGLFQVVYDYTFFCAIPLEWREKWGRRMKEIVQVGGSLVTVMFPYGGNKEDGPPFGVEVGDYTAVLEGEGGFVCKEKARCLEEEMTHEGRQGQTWWCVWERV